MWHTFWVVQKASQAQLGVSRKCFHRGAMLSSSKFDVPFVPLCCPLTCSIWKCSRTKQKIHKILGLIEGLNLFGHGVSLSPWASSCLQQGTQMNCTLHRSQCRNYSTWIQHNLSHAVKILVTFSHCRRWETGCLWILHFCSRLFQVETIHSAQMLMFPCVICLL